MSDSTQTQIGSFRVNTLIARLQAIAEAYPRAALASSLSVEDMLLTHLIAQEQLPIDVFVIDTGRLPAEALALLKRVQTDYFVNQPQRLQVFTPDAAAVADYVNTHGNNAFYESVPLRQRCCQIRKVEPLERALAGRDAWITGQRRAHGPERADLALEEQDNARHMAKFNPLADWDDATIWQVVRAQSIPYNPMHDRGYPSIGCDPCTRAIKPGEPLRAGRWWWEQSQSKECGLHVHPIHLQTSSSSL